MSPRSGQGQPPAPATPTPVVSWRYGIALALLFCAPGIVALALELVSGADRSPPTGDQAVLELGVRAALDFEQWLGPYSRHHWHHPGPLYFYSLAPAYLLGGQTASALHVGASILNLFLLLAILRAAAPLFDTGASRVGAAAVLALWLVHFAAIFSPVGWNAIWTPVLMLMPYGLLLVCSVHLASGKLSYLIPCLVLHAFLAQTHVALVPVASVALLAGVGGYLFMRRGAPDVVGDGRRHELVAAGLMALLWLPVVVDQLWMTHNLGQVIAFFVTAREGLSLGVVADVMARAMATPLWVVLGLGYPESGPGPLVLLVVQGLLLVGLTVAALRRVDRTGRILLVTVLGQWVAAAITVRGIDDPELHYLTYWLGMLSCWTWATIFRGASEWLRGFEWASMTGSRGVRAACVLFAVVAGVQQVRELPTERAWVEVGKPAQQATVSEFASVLAAERQAGRGAPLRVGDNDAWVAASGLMLLADRSGAAQSIDSEWAFMYGDRFVVDDRLEGAFVLSLSVQPGLELLAHSHPFYLYRHSPPPEEDVELELWDARGVGQGGGEQPPTTVGPADDWRQVIRGPARLLVDGESPEPGAPWDHPEAVVFLGLDSWVMLRLPAVPVDGLRVMADNNDEYVLETSVDGRHFEEVGRVPGVGLPGLRWREVPMPRHRAFTWLRISPVTGDGLYGLAEVRAVRGDGFAADLVDGADAAFGEGWGPPEGVEASRGRWVIEREASLIVPAQPRSGSTLVFAAAPAPSAGPSQALSIYLGQRLLRRVAMDPELRSYTEPLPPMECAGSCDLRLRFEYAQSPASLGLGEDRRDLAAWFEAIMLLPSGPTEGPGSR